MSGQNKKALTEATLMKERTMWLICMIATENLISTGIQAAQFFTLS